MTADTYSDVLGFLLMGTGNDNNTWGSNQNSAVFQVFEDAITGYLYSTVAGGTLDLSGTPPPAAVSQTRFAALVFLGTLSTDQIVIVPNLTKLWVVANFTLGAFTLKMQTPLGTLSTAIPQGGYQLVACDGNNDIVVTPFNSQQIQMPDGSISLPPYSNVNETSSGLRRAGTQDWRFTINGVDVLQMTGAGASSPSIFNVLSPNSLQLAGGQIIPPGVEQAYAGIALPAGGWLWEDGTAYSRTTYANLFSALTQTLTGDTHSSITIDNLSVDLRNKGLVGAVIEGTGVPTGTTIVSIAATSLVLSAPATSTGAGVSIRVLPYGQGDASTTFNVPDRRGRVVAGRDDMGGTSANRLTGLTGGVNGDNLTATGGEQAHTLLTSELVAHAHTAASVVTEVAHSHVLYENNGTLEFSGSARSFDGNSGTVGGSTGATKTNLTVATTVDPSTGGGTAFNTVQPTGIGNYIIKT